MTAIAEPEPEAPAPRPTITVVFDGIGAAGCTIEASEDVQPSQIYGLAYLIDLWAREIRMSMIAQAARAAEARQSGLVVPMNREMRRHRES